MNVNDRRLEWIAGIADGDADAFAQLFDSTCRVVYGVARRILGRSEEAEEVVGDVYLQVWRTAGSYDRRRGTVEAWLLTIARARALDRLRAGRCRPDLGAAPLDEAESAGRGRHSPADRADARLLINLAIGWLLPGERHLLELAFFEGYTHRELATLLDQPLGTIKSRLRAGLVRMRRRLEARADIQTDAADVELIAMQEASR